MQILEKALPQSLPLPAPKCISLKWLPMIFELDGAREGGLCLVLPRFQPPGIRRDESATV
jgi:hypothetical protein